MDTTFNLLNWVGVALVIACWIPQTRETLKTKHCGMNSWFLILQCIGSILMCAGATYFKAYPFLLLNAFAAFNAGVNLYFKFHLFSNATTTVKPSLPKPQALVSVK